MDTRATTKGNVPNKHVEEPSRRKFKPMEESIGNLFHSRTPCTQMPPIRCFSPQKFTQKYDQGSDSGYYQSKKRKRTKVYHVLRCPMENCSPYWSRTMGFLLFLQGQEDLHIRKDTILMPDMCTTEELKGIPRKIARPSRTRSNP